MCRITDTCFLKLLRAHNCHDEEQHETHKPSLEPLGLSLLQEPTRIIILPPLRQGIRNASARSGISISTCSICTNKGDSSYINYEKWELNALDRSGRSQSATRRDFFDLLRTISEMPQQRYGCLVQDAVKCVLVRNVQELCHHSIQRSLLSHS